MGIFSKIKDYFDDKKLILSSNISTIFKINFCFEIKILKL